MLRSARLSEKVLAPCRSSSGFGPRGLLALTFTQPAVSNIYPWRVSFSGCLAHRLIILLRVATGDAVAEWSRRRTANPLCARGFQSHPRREVNSEGSPDPQDVLVFSAYRVSACRSPPSLKVTSCFRQHLLSREVSEQRGRRDHMTTVMILVAYRPADGQLVTSSPNCLFVTI